MRSRARTVLGGPALLGAGLLVIVSSVAPAGCSVAEDLPPIPDSVMVPVLADLHVAGARFRLDQDVPASLRDSVLMAHGLDSTRFLDATRWLETHPDAFVALYGAVVDRLNERRNP